jgi:hypothetical protein
MASGTPRATRASPSRRMGGIWRMNVDSTSAIANGIAISRIRYRSMILSTVNSGAPPERLKVD